MPVDRTSRVWEEVRRALGRLLGKVATHELAEDRFGIAPHIRSAEALTWGPAAPGSREAECRPPAMVREYPSLSAASGGGGVDLAAVSTVIGANHALGSAPPAIMANHGAMSPAPVHALGPEHDMPQVPDIRIGDVAISLSSLAAPIVRCAMPPVRRVPVLESAAPKSWKVAPRALFEPRVKISLAAALRVPLRCERLARRSGLSASQEFAEECRQLARTIDAPEADIALIGVFPHVPLGAVKRLAMAEDGSALEVWLKTDQLGRAATLATVTVILGRQRSTGRMIQAVRRAADARGR